MIESPGSNRIQGFCHLDAANLTHFTITTLANISNSSGDPVLGKFYGFRQTNSGRHWKLVIIESTDNAVMSIPKVG
jgi:hypothetical protein